MKLGLDGFDDDVRTQAPFLASRGVTVYERLLLTVQELLRMGKVEELRSAWRDRWFEGHYERPLLLCAALRRDALADPGHPLAQFIGEGASGRESAPDVAIVEALRKPSAGHSLRDRFVQTNEVTRSVSWRLAMGRFAARERVAIFDLGCSAGLNLVADRVPGLSWKDGQGSDVALVPTANVLFRTGIDRAPIDARDGDSALWLRACLWPGQTAREVRLRHALEEASRALERGEMALQKAPAESMPDALMRFASEHSDVAVLAYQSTLLTYLPAAVRETYVRKMREWLSAHPKRALWVEFEDASVASRGPAETRAHWSWYGEVRTRVVGWSEYHPTLINIDEPALRELQSDPDAQ